MQTRNRGKKRHPPLTRFSLRESDEKKARTEQAARPQEVEVPVESDLLNRTSN
jgi:hypothetical protein